MSATRPKSLVAAIVLIVLSSVMTFVPLPGVDMSEVPQAVLMIAYAMAVLGFVAAWLLWQSGSRVGWWIGIVTALLGGLSAAPGIMAAPSQALKTAATTGTLLAVATLVLLLLPASRAAIAGGAHSEA
jgi:hypothetical protein